MALQAEDSVGPVASGDSGGILFTNHQEPAVIRFVLVMLAFGWSLAGFCQAEEGDGVSGLWLGTYTYQDGTTKPTRFAAVLKKEALAFSGKVLENNSFGDDGAAYLSADVMGSLDPEGQVTFYHRYDGTGGQHHLVVYHGKLNEKKTVISGTWAITEEWSGTFSMKLIEAYRRVEEPAEAAEAAERAGAAATPAPTPPERSEQNF